MTPFAPGFGKRVSLFHGIVFSPGIYGVGGGGVGIGWSNRGLCRGSGYMMAQK